VAFHQTKPLQLAQSLCNRRPGSAKPVSQGQVAWQARSVFVFSALNPLMEMLEDNCVFWQSGHTECHYSFLHKATLLDGARGSPAPSVVQRRSRAVTLLT